MSFFEMVSYQSCMAGENERFIVYVDRMRAVFKKKLLIMMADVDDIVGSLQASGLSSYVGGVNEQEED